MSRPALARPRARGTTLIEILVALAVLAMISLMIYGAFESMSRGKRAEGARAERSRQGREAIDRIGRELSSAYLSLHAPLLPAYVTQTTAFIGTNGSTFDRVDFTSFAHRRVDREAKESDQAEIGYFVVEDPKVPEKMDLVRREQVPIDLEPQRGGVVNVVCEDVESFDVRYLDPLTGQWVEQWDSTSAVGQFRRMPLEVKITLVVKGQRNEPSYRYVNKLMIPIQQPLTFAYPR